uniref:Putative secreted protein n=1 Tax=Anopheles darlingi TaxID=43151 RepID=A0A2M4DMC3_ANODA
MWSAPIFGPICVVLVLVGIVFATPLTDRADEDANRGRSCCERKWGMGLRRDEEEGTEGKCAAKLLIATL